MHSVNETGYTQSSVRACTGVRVVSASYPAKRTNSQRNTSRNQQQHQEPEEPQSHRHLIETRGGEELLQECLKLLLKCVAIKTELGNGGEKRKPIKPRMGPKGNVVCWKCKQKGHIQSNWPKKERGSGYITPNERKVYLQSSAVHGKALT